MTVENNKSDRMEQAGDGKGRSRAAVARHSSRRPGEQKKHRSAPVIAALLLLLLIGCIGGGYIYVKKYMPTKERADLNEYFDNVAGNNILIYLNQEIVKNEKGYLVIGRYQNGQVYLPFDWVIGTLNRRFYWASDVKQLFYSEPEETIKISEGDPAQDGAQAFFWDGKDLFLNVTLVSQYTDIRYHAHTDQSNKWIFIFDNDAPEKQAVLKGKESVRVLGGVKSPVLTDLAKGDTVTVLETLENWSKVSTNDGYIGYLRNKKLSEVTEVTPEDNFTAPVFKHILREDGSKVVMGFHQITTAAGNSTLDTVTANAGPMNVIAPTWFVLTTSEGDFMSYASEDYVSKAHAKGYQVWATVNNFDSGKIDTSVLLPSSALREQLINGLVSTAQQVGIDGLNIDFEQIPQSLGRDYVQFMRELSIACRKAGIILSVDCYVPYNYNSYYDIEELGTFCDYVVIMCYDEHYSGGEEGSVASISYTDRGIQEALKKIAPEQIIIAVPFYTRVWITQNGKTTSDAMGIKQAREWITSKGIKLTWDETTGQNYGEIQDGDSLKKVWMEDEDSLNLKMKHIREAGVGGVAAWKLGQEPTGFWDILNLNMQEVPEPGANG